MPIKPHKGDKWPQKVHIYIYAEEDDVRYLYEESKNPSYDLSENLPFHFHTVYLGMETLSKNWPVWDEESILLIEELIDIDLNYDGNSAFITRITEKKGQPCSEEFIWRLDLFEVPLSSDQRQQVKILAQELQLKGYGRYKSLNVAYDIVIDGLTPIEQTPI
jgi:hypothetical protein